MSLSKKAMNQLTQAICDKMAPVAVKQQKKKSQKQQEQKVSAPVATSQLQKFKNNMNKRIENIIGSELIQTINGSTTFVANKFICNAGMPAVFPVLSVKAAKSQYYRFKRLRFRYVTRTATTTVGSVIMSPNYDPKDPAPSSEAIASDTQDAVEDVDWREINCSLDIATMNLFTDWRLIRAGAVAGDLSTYDAANFFLCTVEQVGTAAIGKLWVDYDVDLAVVSNSAVDGTFASKTSSYSNSSDQVIATNTPTGALWNSNVSDPLGIGLAPALGLFTPPAGTYNVLARFVLEDSVAEQFQGQASIFKNGAALPIAAFSQFLLGSATTNQVVNNLDVFGTVSLNGTDTLSISLTLIGSAGTLKSIGGQNWLSISPA